MDTRGSTSRKKEGGGSNQRIPLGDVQVPIVVLEEEKEDVPLQEPQVLRDPQEPQVPPMPEAPFVEGDMTNSELRDA